VAKAARASQSAGPDPVLLEGLCKAQAGPKVLLGSDALFPSGAKGKQAAQQAIDQGYLTTRKQQVPPPSGKGKSKEVVVGELTDKGRHFILEVASPKVVLEALLPAVQALSRPTAPAGGPNLEALRAEQEKATRACVKAIEDAGTKLQKAIEAAFAKMEQAVLKAVPAPGAAPVVNVGPVLAALQAALTRVGATVPTSSSPSGPSAGPAPALSGAGAEQRAVPSAKPEPSATPPAVTSETLRSEIHRAYDHLCLFQEFRDKLVEIPRLYHETVRRVPGLSVDRFHQELESLSRERQLELHKLNEVHAAKERHLAIEKDDRLYYYVFWK
jgi:hypothetical protein